jgi:hypothetical protein
MLKQILGVIILDLLFVVVMGFLTSGHRSGFWKRVLYSQILVFITVIIIGLTIIGILLINQTI